MRPPLTLWGPPPERPILAPGELHLWRLQLDCRPLPAEEGSALSRLLSPDERARAARLLLPEKAAAYIIGRARLRQILGRYLHRPPAELSFAYGPYGKPALADAALQFNLTHSGGWLLLAVADRPVGVDLEHIDAGLDVNSVAERFFARAERAQLAAVAPHRLRRIFYRLWTRKEAFLKGAGGGWSTIGESAVPTGDWKIRNLFVQRGFVGAVAIPGAIVRIRRWIG